MKHGLCKTVEGAAPAGPDDAPRPHLGGSMNAGQAPPDRHPRLRRLSERSQSIEEYCRSIAEAAPTAPAPASRQLLATVARQLADQVPGLARAGLEQDLRRPHTVVSLAEHHASIAHPLTMSAIATQALYSGLSGSPLISFTCATVPLDNDLFPRGTMIAGRKVAFLPQRHRAKSPLTCPAMNTEDMSGKLRQLERAGLIDAATSAAVAQWWSRIAPEVAACRLYWQQVSLLNQRIFQGVFALEAAPLVMLPIELIARDMLLADLDRGRYGWLDRSLFDPAARTALLRSLDGIRCCWNADASRGTFLFWSVDEANRLRPVFPRGDELTTRDGRAVCRIEPAAIHAALTREALVPAGSYALIRIAVQCRLRHFGGSLQYDYLSHIKRRLVSGLGAFLTEDELRGIDQAPDSYYVDFAEHEALGGDLGRLKNPISKADLASFGAASIGEAARRALDWIATSVTRY
ncbi:hypothetical protein GCM10009850_072330 [Nonomuraea monospora]|uniref:Uncharacterized protein n=1 Tax=Nonomuraea monospora TaxID=568818 RepID=A0ABN3CQQ4_9ACTN